MNEEREYWNKSDRDLLIEIHATTAVLDERTKVIPEFKEELMGLQEADARHDTDIKWIKRMMFGGLPGVATIGTIIGVVFNETIKKVFS